MSIWNRIKQLIRKLTPHFFKRFDDWLIIRSPLFWTGCLHYVLLYSALLAVLFACPAFLLPVEYYNIEFALPIVTILSFIGLLGWANYQSSYSIIKNYGRCSRFFQFNYCLMYFIAGFVISLPTFSTYVIFTYNHQPSYYSHVLSLYYEIMLYLEGLITLLFILIVYHSVKNLFNSKSFFKGILVYLLGVWPIVGIMAIILDNINMDSDDLVILLTIFFALLSFGILIHLTALKRRTNLSILLWQLMIYSFVVAMVLLDNYDFPDYSYLLMLSLLYFIYLPWQRGVLYKLYALPR